jgi:hypothetical protein
MITIVPLFPVFLEREGTQFSRNLGPQIRGRRVLVSWTWS